MSRSMNIFMMRRRANRYFKNTPAVKAVISSVSRQRSLVQSLVSVFLKPLIAPVTLK